MATIHVYSPVNFELWDFRNSVDRGIGGSETCHVEMAWRLARRGHTVVSYGPIPEDCPREWRGVTWKSLDDADFTQPGVWLLFRCPTVLATWPVALGAMPTMFVARMASARRSLGAYFFTS